MSQEQPTPDKPAVYTVAPGKTIDCLRGPVRAGKALRPKDFLNGEATLEALVSAGAVVKTSRP